MDKLEGEVSAEEDVTTYQDTTAPLESKVKWNGEDVQ